MDRASLKLPTLPCESLALTAKWYVFPLLNCVNVQAIGKSKALTSPTFFHKVDTTGLLALS